MRAIALALAFFAVLVASPYQAAAEAPAKPVEVINLPEVQDVNVLNVPPAAVAARFQFVGFTTDSFSGDLGGFFGGHLKCQMDFPQSRMCTIGEVQGTTTIPGGVATDTAAWVNQVVAGSSDGEISPAGCDSWTTDFQPHIGFLIEFTHGGRIAQRPCSLSHPIACCALVP